VVSPNIGSVDISIDVSAKRGMAGVGGTGRILVKLMMCGIRYWKSKKRRQSRFVDTHLTGILIQVYMKVYRFRDACMHAYTHATSLQLGVMELEILDLWGCYCRNPLCEMRSARQSPSRLTFHCFAVGATFSQLSMSLVKVS